MPSNGQLIQMEPERRKAYIATLSPAVRRELANIALLGAARRAQEVADLTAVARDLTSRYEVTA